jgi:purine nucleosidase
MRFLFLAAAAALLATPGANSQPKPRLDVIVDQDGATDDLIAVAMVANSATVRLAAVAICPGDAYLGPATEGARRVLGALGLHGVSIAQGHDAGRHPFPAEWRRAAADPLDAPAWRAAKPADNPVVSEDAPHHLARLLSGPRDFTILETGPLTNIAAALKINPAIKRHIRRIYIMGGAVRTKGNVEAKGYDGSAEWNIYNQPQAAAEVVASGVPITLVALDATNKAPLRRAVVDQLARQPSKASQMAAQAYDQILRGPMANDYYFWDTMTAAVLVDPSLVRTQRLRIRVITSGPSEGRTVEDPKGAPVDVALDADAARVQQTFLQLLGRGP